MLHRRTFGTVWMHPYLLSTLLLLVIVNNLSHLKSPPVWNPLAHTLQSTVVSNMEAKHIHEKWNLSPQSIRSIAMRCSVKPRMAMSHKEEWVHTGQKTQVLRKTYNNLIGIILVSSYLN